MLFRLFAVLFRLALLPFFLVRNARTVPRGAFVAIEIDGGVADIVRAPRLWEMWRPHAATSLHALRVLVDEVIKDDRVRGLLVTIKAFRGGMANATSLRSILMRARAAGREVVVHLPVGGTTKELYVATAATRILVGPQALVAPLGFASATRYVRQAVDKAGLEPEVFARGTYKSAGEQLVRDTMSEPQKEQVGALLDVFYKHVIDALVEGRKLSRDAAHAVIDGAPYRAEEAVRAGIADGAAYEDEIPTLLGQDGKRAHILFGDRYLHVVRAARLLPLRKPGIIGVVTVHGAIASQTAVTQSLATDERVIAAVRKARRDGRVRAVVLHVDSPGGSALASDRIHHEIEQLAAEKPVVACMANVAASGGYYVAAPAHAIIAQPTTITGSIGVVAARVVVEPLLAKLGIHTEILKRGARADLLEPTRRLSDDERSAFDRELEGMYQAFLGVVARGRKRSVDEVHRVAQGRVWSGADAASVGLVDALGGFDEALDRARALAGGPDAESRQPAILRGGRNPIPPLDPPRKQAARIARALFQAAFVEVTGELGIDVTPLALSRDPILAWCPLPPDLT
jgi:protease-4